MTIFKKLTALCLAALLLLPGVPNVRADDSSAQLRTLVNYFHYYQEDAALDYELILEQIRAQDPGLANTWANILTFWSGINSGTIYSNVLPDGLPEDDSLCIVVMGYQLYSDGTMRPELESRMETALASARKYPNAYILCTGGGTASKNRNATEAGQMAAWLRRNGIDSSRIIVEGDAMSTIQNAIYGCALLYSTGKTIYILDEPTTGLHTADVAKLLEVLQKLCDVGNTVLVIEHNLDVIKSADHIIDLGPEGGDGGGRIVATGTPEEVALVEGSYTGQYLKKWLKR